jgi:hypothetical protein
MICFPRQIIFGSSNQDKMGAASSMCEAGKRSIERFGGRDLRNINQLEDLGVDNMIILEWIFSR